MTVNTKIKEKCTFQTIYFHKYPEELCCLFPFGLSFLAQGRFFFFSNPALLHIWVTLMSLEGCQDQIQASPVCVYCIPKGRLWPQALCEKVAGESYHHDTTGPAQHPEVGTSPGTSAPMPNEYHCRPGLKGGPSLMAACCSRKLSGSGKPLPCRSAPLIIWLQKCRIKNTLWCWCSWPD